MRLASMIYPHIQWNEGKAVGKAARHDSECQIEVNTERSVSVRTTFDDDDDLQ